MQVAKVYEIVKDLSERPEEIDLPWKNSQFENLKIVRPKQLDRLARILLLELIMEAGHDVSELEGGLCRLWIYSENFIPPLKIYAKGAVLDSYGNFKFKSIIPRGYTHLFLLGVEPDELRFKIVEARNLRDYIVTYSRSGYRIEIDQEDMYTFDKFEREVEEMLNDYPN